MKVLITGASGFLGSHLCDKFIKEDYKVIAVDNFITGNADNLKHLKNNKNFKFYNFNVSDEFFIEENVDAVLHFASPASPDAYLKNPIETLKVGSYATFNCLNIAKQNKAKFLMASTSEVYGDPKVNPQPESYWGNVNPVGPRSVYDEAKRFSEAATMGYHRHFGLDTKIVRIFNTYGPRMALGDGRVVPNFIYQALKGLPITIYKGGKQTRSFTYVDDLVDGIYKLLQSNENMPVNIGNTTETTILDFAKKVIELTNSKSELTFVEPKDNRVVDDPKVRNPVIDRAKSILNWQPTTSLEQGLKPTIDYFKGKIESS